MPWKSFRKSDGYVIGTKKNGGAVKFHTTSVATARKRAAMRSMFKHMRSK